jgi:hypothetical protein
VGVTQGGANIKARLGNKFVLEANAIMATIDGVVASKTKELKGVSNKLNMS